jgi:acetoacetyl-CoA synthetase
MKAAGEIKGGSTMQEPMWRPGPARVEAANLTRFMRHVRETYGVRARDYFELHRWSVAEPEKFWTAVWDTCGVIAETRGGRAVADKNKMPGARFFPDAKLNFAENLLRRRDEGDAIVFRNEAGAASRLSARALAEQVGRVQQALAAAGVGAGDRVAAFMPNIPETVIAMLAAASIGAVWSSCSPDFGVGGVIDRFGQISPKVLFAADGYYYNGKVIDSRERLQGVAARLPGLSKLVLVPYIGVGKDAAALDRRAVTWDDFLAPFAPREPAFERLPFNSPLYILYSSGTTGMPKCIVHGAGGTLLKHLQEHQHQADIHPGDRVFYYTTCGWMMWNWLASALASQAAILLYDGAPSAPTMNALFDYADAEAMTHLGTSAKFIDALLKAGANPKATHRLRALRTILSTGSPLAPAGFDYVYRNVKSDVALHSVSGGTDIIGCFVGGNPLGPVWRGEIAAPALAMDVRVFDENGASLPPGGKGELVCVNSFPSMPIGFWNDPGDVKYREAYFARFPNVWCHGDWVEITPHGGMIIYGRSDAVLNPGGVRIGTAEIYRQVERLPEVVESLVIGQDWENDVRIVLFVRLAEGIKLDDKLQARIKQEIRAHTSPRHVPAKIVQVADIPRTINNKIVELAVRNVVHGRPVKNKDALMNPQALELFRDLAELRT